MNRLHGLDLLRAVAIVWVMLFHSYIVGGLGGPLDAWARRGWMGVDLFFVLSGYLIGAQAFKSLRRGEPLPLRDFYVRRAFRVLPAFLAVVALYAAWPAFREDPELPPLARLLTFTANLPADTSRRAFSHVWSLCVEEHFYLVFPFLAWWLTKRPSPVKLVATCLAIVVAGAAIRAYVWLHELAPSVPGGDVDVFDDYLRGIYYPTYTRLDGLLAGVVLAVIEAWRPTWWSRLQRAANPILALGLTTCALATWLFRDRVAFLPTVVGFPLLSVGLAMIVASATSTEGWLGRLRIPGASWVAVTSYSLYLTHKAVFHGVERLVSSRPEATGLVAFAAYAAATLAAGALLHYGVERPFLRLRELLPVRAVQSATPTSPAERSTHSAQHTVS